MRVSKSAFYHWQLRGAKIIDHETWLLCHRMRTLFTESRQSLGSRQLMQQLRKEDFKIGRYRVISLMKQLGLSVKKKKRFVVTTDSRHKQPVAANLLNREFEPAEKNQIWTTDITNVWTLEGWVYLAVVMDLHSRQIIGWNTDRSMTTNLIERALIKAVNIRRPSKGLMHHSDRGSQYASAAYQQLLKSHDMVCSMSRKGNCWDNAPTERFCSSLKREWLTGNVYTTREAADTDIKSYMVYYNTRRLHTTLNNQTPVEFEQCA